MRARIFCAALCLLGMVCRGETTWEWLENETLPLGGKGFRNTDRFFDRLPSAAEVKLPPALECMKHNSTGMYLRFRTDAERMRIEWTATNADHVDPLIPEQGLFGVDIYGWDESADGGKGAWRFRGNKRYWRDRKNPGTAEFAWNPGRPCLIFLPLRANLTKFRLGVPKGRKVEPYPYRERDAKPIVHYGTSIVHGGCASRPGMAFTAVAARDLDMPYINLGFSGGARMESCVPDVLAQAEASLYVIDARWNMTPEMIATNCIPFLRRMKELKPDVPLLLCEGCTVGGPNTPNREIRKAYDTLKKEDPAKWRNLYYFPEDTMLPKEDQEATHDFCHPNDYGMIHMGHAYARRIRDVLDADRQQKPVVDVEQGSKTGKAR